jgi:UDP-N-acetylmuramate--alanine ligase
VNTLLLSPANTEKFFKLFAQHLIITNIELDHPDYYKDINDVISAFQSLAEKLPSDGNLIIWHEEPNRELIRSDAPVTTYGFSEDADIKAENIIYTNDGSAFDIVIQRTHIGRLLLPVAGKHNILDALAAVALAFRLSIPPENILHSLSSFDGTKRRFERLGIKDGAIIFDDYAHHPTEIQTTLDGARLSFPDRRIRAVFQPHTFSRTEKLLTEFSKAFSIADEVILADIFSSARENKASSSSVSSSKLAAMIHQQGIATKYFPTLNEISSYLSETLQDGDIIITLGAGDVYKVGQTLIS